MTMLRLIRTFRRTNVPRLRHPSPYMLNAPRPRPQPGVLLLFAVFLLALSGWPAAAHAQSDLPQVTRTYAIENARIVQAPGRVIEQGTVIVRDGRILDAGADAEVPYDAERINGDSLVVYAGLIDGFSHTGVQTPEPDNEDVERPGDPPYDRAGIQPDRDVRTLLNPSHGRIDQLRQAGFTTAQVAPKGDLLPGTAAVVQLAGDEADAMLLVPGSALYMQFDGASGVYPATPMAVMSSLRQLYREATRRRALTDRYADEPRAMERPPEDAVHRAFFPVVAGERPLLIRTEDALEIHRALQLQRELGFTYQLAGLVGSSDALDALRATEAPLFLTLDLPEAADEQADRDTTEATPTDSTARAVTPEEGSYFQSDLRTRSYEDVEAEKENLEARQSMVREEYDATAARLHEAGLRFGFSTAEAKPGEVHDHLRRMIAQGLPEDAALAALTTDAAALLDLDDRLGTVEAGKIANLVVTTGNLFAEDTEIRHVFVDGQRFDYSADDASSGDDDATADPVGTWSYTVTSPQGDVDGTLTLTGSPDALEGTITGSDGEETTLEEVELSGAALTFQFDAGNMGVIDASLSIDGDEMEGTIDVSGAGSFPMTATRTSGPDA